MLACASMTEGGMGPYPTVGAIPDGCLHPIAAWRRYRGLSQAELARRIGLSQVWLSRIENGGGTGSAATRRKLAEALDAPVWALEEIDDTDKPVGKRPTMEMQTVRNEIELQLDHARQTGKSFLLLSACEIHRAVGGYPGPGHRMPICCAALRETADARDFELVHTPTKGNGASLAYRFAF